MREIKAFKRGKAAVGPSILYSFTKNEEYLSNIKRIEVLRYGGTRKFGKKEIGFAKKLVNIIVNETR